MQQVCGGDEDVIGNIYISATGEEEDMVGWLGSVNEFSSCGLWKGNK
jgi:hypothetical protein